MFSRKFRTFLLSLAFSLFSFAPVIAQNLPTNLAAKLLPEKLGEFRAASPLKATKKELVADEIDRDGLISEASRTYVAKDGQRLSVTLSTSASDAGAYALLTEERRRAESSGNEGGTTTGNIGTASYFYWDGLHNDLVFYKGRVSVYIIDGGGSRDSQLLLDFGKTLAETLDKGEGDIPVLIKHLPDWQKASRTALYVTSDKTLKRYFADGSVFSVVSFEGGAQAVVANYKEQGLIIVEFNTPQLATDNDQRIVTKIQDLRNQGQPIPAYRRVGNYAVFVVGAPNEQAADELIDQVKYQQVVQWLGENPFLYEEATREFTETTLGVFVSVVKASGLALVTCFAVGGLLGGFLFIRRRAQQRAVEAYTDAGGMLRLNLDEMTPQTDPTKLLGRGN
ncbi:MAG TPA: hypothetical protein DCK99_15670 [Blastocatellia bacterium]|nr:hypothetical protein [Blastocatellia bacterium]